MNSTLLFNAKPRNTCGAEYAFFRRNLPKFAISAPQVFCVALFPIASGDRRGPRHADARKTTRLQNGQIA
jgi:hypothetical protein